MKKNTIAHIIYFREAFIAFDGTGHSAMCPIKGPTRLKPPHCRGTGRRRRLLFECL